MPLKVAHVISARGAGGAERFLASLLREGCARGWDQIVLNPFSCELSPQFASLCGPVPYNALPCDRMWTVPSLRRALKKELSAFGPALTHTLLFHSTALMAAIPRVPGEARLLTHVYGQVSPTIARHLPRAFVDRWAVSRFDRIAAISESVEQFLLSKHRCPRSKVSCIPLGWEGEPLPSTADPARPTAICVARLRREKNHALLLQAFAIVHRELPEARLVLVGDGPLRGDIAALAEALDLGSSVEITGVVAEVWPYLAAAHVFVLASRSEAFGIAVAEAMAAGLPVVAADVGGIAELVVPGVTGELFAGEDVNALATALLHLLRSPELRARMGAAGRERAQGFRMQEPISLYADLCESLVRDRHFTPSSDTKT